MSEIICERLKRSVGKNAVVYLENGFRFGGKISNCDDIWLEILEPAGKYKLIKIEHIYDADIEGEGE